MEKTCFVHMPSKILQVSKVSKEVEHLYSVLRNASNALRALQRKEVCL